ncbi:MAG: 50S ribosomal protein L25 [Myxococcales bacterium]|nr:50S ribosomal protein L25 [Myxococcales bacterium]
MDTFPIIVKPRNLAGSDVARALLRAGLLPAVVYGPGEATRSVTLEPKAVRKGLIGPYGRNQVFALELDGAPRLAIAREVQIDPVKRSLRHVDFYLVGPDSTIEVTVPVVLHGRSLGQKAGGRLDHIARTIKVRCTPASLPKSIEFDVSPIDNGMTVTVDALPMPPGVEAVFKRPFKVLEVMVPKAEPTGTEVAATPGAAAAATPAKAAPAKAAPAKDDKGGKK